jgi:hypothetical protein
MLMRVLHLLLHLPLLHLLQLHLMLHRQLPLFRFQSLLHELHVGQMLMLLLWHHLWLQRRECDPWCTSAGRSHATVAEEMVRVRYRAGVLLMLWLWLHLGLLILWLMVLHRGAC